MPVADLIASRTIRLEQVEQAIPLCLTEYCGPQEQNRKSVRECYQTEEVI